MKRSRILRWYFWRVTRVVTAAAACAGALLLWQQHGLDLHLGPEGEPAAATPPSPHQVSDAIGDVRRALAELPLRAEEPLTGYDRDEFPHWSEDPQGCSTRERVLQRQASPPAAFCTPITATTWTSPYDGVEHRKASELDIDHVVPLAEAWRSGAGHWTRPQRQAFANDLDRPQLVAVTDRLNQAKGDQDPAAWMPPATTYRCPYVTAYVQVKHHHRLAVDPAEKSAIDTALSAC